MATGNRSGRRFSGGSKAARFVMVCVALGSVSRPTAAQEDRAVFAPQAAMPLAVSTAVPVLPPRLAPWPNPGSHLVQDAGRATPLRGMGTAIRAQGPLGRAATDAVRSLGIAERQFASAPSSSGPWVTRHPVLFGALVGTAGGAALSRVDAIGGQSHDPRVALIGTGVGAWAGLIGSAVQTSRRGGKVSRGTKAGIVAGAIALAVVPYATCHAAGGCRE